MSADIMLPIKKITKLLSFILDNVEDLETTEIF